MPGWTRSGCPGFYIWLATMLVLCAVVTLSACGGGVDPKMQPRDGSADSVLQTGDTGTTGTTNRAGMNRDNDGTDEPEPVLEPSSCPGDGSNCVVAQGRVLYVEKVDPDGDGDAHFVTSSSESVTLPGITIFDVRADLRPDPLPGPGDLVGGAGPVYPGHAGQKQIQVTEFHVAR